jgi:NAD(P)-dependent dehydrogenase (short-subunit alcohol dehydrogenase family)
MRRILEKWLVKHVEHLAGRIDTWVNNAGVSIYGRIEEVPDADSRRLFDTNFWGVVNGSRIAAKIMKETGGGAIINVGSTLSDRAVPIQGMYSASKHAVKGFTDAFRMELESDDVPISVTLVKPAAIDTPYKVKQRTFWKCGQTCLFTGNGSRNNFALRGKP